MASRKKHQADRAAREREQRSAGPVAGFARDVDVLAFAIGQSPPAEPSPVRHWHLVEVVQRLPGDYAPYGTAGPRGMDCSCGCIWYEELAGDLGTDWGVCVNPQSHRAGLLTFEHQAGQTCYEGGGGHE